MKKKIIFGLVFPALLLSSCTFSFDLKDNSSISDEEERDYIEDSLEDVPIEVEEYQGDLTPLPIVKGV